MEPPIDPEVYAHIRPVELPERRRSVIAEGRSSTLGVLACVPVVLMLVGILIGLALDTSQYSLTMRSIGPILFYGGLLYATYEFTSAFLRRDRYITTDGTSIYIIHHRPIYISSIDDIYLELGLASPNIVIAKHDGGKTKIRGHFLRDDARTVWDRLTALTV